MTRALAALAAALAATPFAFLPGALARSEAPPRLEPSVAVTRFVAAIRGAGPATLTWQAPETVALRPAAREDANSAVVVRGGTTYYGRTPGLAGSIERRTYAAEPDAFTPEGSVLPLATRDFVLAETRAGKLRLRGTRVGGRAAWRVKTLLHANECAGLARGTAELWLDRRTLLPLRLVERRGARSSSAAISYRFPRSLPASAFRIPPLGSRPLRRDGGFVRAAPLRAASRLAYHAMLPTRVPPGFSLAVSGWSKTGGITGPEGSNPRHAQLFAAVYRRGFERIDVTQRLAGRRGWLTDPFGVECGFLRSARTRVKGAPAFYGASEEITPHLYWRSGRVLFTVSGPFPLRELRAIAQSLGPVGGE